MQSNALEKSNSDNTGTTMGLKIAVIVQRRNGAFILKSSLPTFAQLSAAAKKHHSRFRSYEGKNRE